MLWLLESPMGVMKNFMTFFRKCDCNEKKRESFNLLLFWNVKTFFGFRNVEYRSFNRTITSNRKASNIERFYVTSRPPYLCSKTMKRRPCWCNKAVLSLSCESRTLFRMLKLSFVPTNCVTAGHVTEDDLLKMIPRCVF